MGQTNLNPQEQSVLFSLLQKAGAQPTSGGMSSDTPDLQAQAGVGNVDNGQIQALFGNTSTPSVQMQEGDKMHPNDAMAQIAQGMTQGPAKPAGIELATGPQIQRDKNGSQFINVDRNGIIPKLLGLKQKASVDTPNYFDAIDKAGLTKYLPKGLARTPDGTPFVGPDTAKQALDAQKVLMGQGKEVYSSVDQLTSQGLSPEDSRKLLAANPQGVTSKEVSNFMGSQRLQDTHTIAEARATMAGVAKIGQQLKVGGFDAAQAAAESAVKNLGNAQRAQAAIDQIMSSGGIADQRQRSELASSIAQLAGNSQGVLTDERMGQFLPTSAKGKFANIYEYWTNERQPIDFTGFLPQLQDLLQRETVANKGIANGASSLGIDILGQTQPKAAKSLTAIRSNNSLVGNPPPPVAKPTGMWKVIR